MAGLLTAPVPEVPRQPGEWHAGRLAFERHVERRAGLRDGRRAFERHDGQAFGRQRGPPVRQP